MGDGERMLGELLEFKRAAIRDLEEIKRGMDSLHAFKWRVAGGAAVLSVMMTGIAEAIHIYLKIGG